MSWLSQMRKKRFVRSIKNDPDRLEKLRAYSLEDAYKFAHKIYLWRQWAIKKPRGRMFKELYCLADYLKMIGRNPRSRKACGSFREHRRLTLSRFEKYCPKGK